MRQIITLNHWNIQEKGYRTYQQLEAGYWRGDVGQCLSFGSVCPLYSPVEHASEVFSTLTTILTSSTWSIDKNVRVFFFQAGFFHSLFKVTKCFHFFVYHVCDFKTRRNGRKIRDFVRFGAWPKLILNWPSFVDSSTWSTLTQSPPRSFSLWAVRSVRETSTVTIRALQACKTHACDLATHRACVPNNGTLPACIILMTPINARSWMFGCSVQKKMWRNRCDDCGPVLVQK